jgi:hypothetical protein
MGREARKLERSRMQFSPLAAEQEEHTLRLAVEDTVRKLDDTLRQKRELRASAHQLLRRLSPTTE